MAPEVFAGRYTEKADVFSLGIIFFAILERTYITIDKKRFYGAFKRIRIGGSPIDGYRIDRPWENVGLGYAMTENPNTTITFSSLAENSTLRKMQELTLRCLGFDEHDRPSAPAVHYELLEDEDETKSKGYFRAIFIVVFLCLLLLLFFSLKKK